MKKPNGLASEMLKPINTSAIVILGVFTVLWGLFLINPFWAVFNQAALFGALDALAPEYFWGAVAIFCGTLTCFGAVKRGYKPLLMGSLVSTWFWSMISMFYFIGDPLNTGGITVAAFAVYSVFIYLNIKVNYKDNQGDLP